VLLTYTEVLELPLLEAVSGDDCDARRLVESWIAAAATPPAGSGSG